jgi:hypothetical protein
MIQPFSGLPDILANICRLAALARLAEAKQPFVRVHWTERLHRPIFSCPKQFMFFEMMIMVL